MATLRKRNSKWHVQIRHAGHPSQSKSFLSKADAHVWARHIEGEMDKAALPIDTRVLEQMTVADLITRYKDTVRGEKHGVTVIRASSYQMIFSLYWKVQLYRTNKMPQHAAMQTIAGVPLP